MIVGVLAESAERERRVALVPRVVPMLAKSKLEVLVEPGAGREAGFSDAAFVDAGARLARDREEIFSSADIVSLVRAPKNGADRERWRSGQVVLGLLDPWSDPGLVRGLAERGVRAFALELVPRITRAQAMDALTSMATLSGYKAVLLAAESLDRIFPMMITAAGTLPPARVFILGAGVAGLQAIGTARRLGAAVQAYDVRAAVREQVESLGAKFVDLGLDTGAAEGAGGYARAMDEEFYRRQRKALARVVAESDVVIATAAIPGRRAPLLVTADAVRGMRSGAVIVDLAAATGGNCERTKPGETVHSEGVTILGPLDLPATLPHDASQMYARNVASFLQNLVRDGEVRLDLEDPILRETLLTRDGAVVHAAFAGEPKGSGGT